MSYYGPRLTTQCGATAPMSTRRANAARDARATVARGAMPHGRTGDGLGTRPGLLVALDGPTRPAPKKKPRL
jgi:hypothetical protein